MLLLSWASASRGEIELVMLPPFLGPGTFSGSEVGGVLLDMDGEFFVPALVTMTNSVQSTPFGQTADLPQGPECLGPPWRAKETRSMQKDELNKVFRPMSVS